MSEYFDLEPLFFIVLPLLIAVALLVVYRIMTKGKKLTLKEVTRTPVVHITEKYTHIDISPMISSNHGGVYYVHEEKFTCDIVSKVLDKTGSDLAVINLVLPETDTLYTVLAQRSKQYLKPVWTVVNVVSLKDKETHHKNLGRILEIVKAVEENYKWRV